MMSTELKLFLRKLNNSYNIHHSLRSKINGSLSGITPSNAVIKFEEIDALLKESSITSEEIEQYKKKVLNFANKIVKREEEMEKEEEIKEGEKEEKDVDLNLYVEKTPSLKVKKLKKYDVIKSFFCTFGGNRFKHYGVVYKVENELAYVLTITSKQTFGRYPIKKSRMFSNTNGGGSYYTPCFIIIPEKIAVQDFYCVLDAKKEFDETVKEVIKNIIGKKNGKTR